MRMLGRIYGSEEAFKETKTYLPIRLFPSQLLGPFPFDFGKAFTNTQAEDGRYTAEDKTHKG